jgi:hypothetical protein
LGETVCIPASWKMEELKNELIASGDHSRYVTEFFATSISNGKMATNDDNFYKVNSIQGTYIQGCLILQRNK